MNVYVRYGIDPPHVRRVSVRCQACGRVFAVDIAESSYRMWRSGLWQEARALEEPWSVSSSWCCTEDGRFVAENNEIGILTIHGGGERK